MFEIQRALVLGAHTDDEFACAGTIARLVESGVEVHYTCFSSCEDSVPDGFDVNVLKREVMEAIAVLGIEPSRFELLDYPVRQFPHHRQEILEHLVRLRSAIRPELVLLPALSDIHQDHSVIAQEGRRAFKHSTLLGFEMPMNTLTFAGTCLVQLEARHLAKKVALANCYRSQQQRPYMNERLIEALATVRGLQMNAEAAEAFEVIRLCVR